MTDKTATAVFGSRPSSRVIKHIMVAKLGLSTKIVGGTWFGSRVLNTYLKTGDRLVRYGESVETAHSTVNRLVFSRATENHQILRSDAK